MRTFPCIVSINNINQRGKFLKKLWWDIQNNLDLLLLGTLQFDRCYLNLIYFTGIINLTYDWSKGFFSFCYSNFLFKLAYLYIFCFFSLRCNRLFRVSGIK